MPSSIFAFNESLNAAARWATRSATVSGTGVTTANFPSSNIFTKNPNQYFERTGITGSTTITVDVDLVSASSGARPLDNYSMVIGLLNVYAFNESNLSPVSVDVRAAESTTAFTGPYESDRTHQVQLSNFYGQTPRQTWFPRPAVNTGRTAGGAVPPRYLRLQFSGPGVTWTLRIGRLCNMSGLVCAMDNALTRYCTDTTEIIRSFSGYPYPLEGTVLRAASGSIRALPDDSVTSSAGLSGNFVPSVQAINLISGTSDEVCVIERVDAPALDSVWQFQPVFGYLRQPLRASRSAATSSTDGLSTSEFDIEAIPFGN